MGTETITLDDFKKFEIKIGKITAAETIEGSNIIAEFHGLARG